MKAHDEHVIEALGRSKVIIREGKVIEVGLPMISECPLVKRFRKPVGRIHPEAVKENIENRISEIGMFTKDRKLVERSDFVLFGASELISNALEIKMIDAAVIVCDGAGTVIVNEPDLVQGIGGRMSGIVTTSPIKEVMDTIESKGGTVLDRSSAKIDQYGGTELALCRGFSRVAVTVADGDSAKRIRDKFPETIIIGVHLTGVSKQEAEVLVANCDIVSGCASKWIRELGGKAALMQAGVSIPVFALSQKGREIVLEKIKKTPMKTVIKVANLPYSEGNSPYPLV
ncbi:MAG: DUF2099 family protein [Candidatus Methanomethylicia archaeon]|nr:DUF2099 family protein [Candidatus Methanomethylicia archaeon]